jgi:hypothetical protein
MKVDTVSRPEDRLSEQEKHTLFYRQISKSRDLEHDLNIYHRADAGTPERSYAYLLKAAKKYIERKQEDANVEDNRRSMHGPAAPAADSSSRRPSRGDSRSKGGARRAYS